MYHIKFQLDIWTCHEDILVLLEGCETSILLVTVISMILTSDFNVYANKFR